MVRWANVEDAVVDEADAPVDETVQGVEAVVDEADAPVDETVRGVGFEVEGFGGDCERFILEEIFCGHW